MNQPSKSNAPTFQELSDSFARSYAAFAHELMRLADTDEAASPTIEPGDREELATASPAVRKSVAAAIARAAGVGEEPAVKVTSEELRGRIIRGKFVFALADKGWSQADLAKQLNKDESAVSRVMRHPERCKPTTLAEYARALDLDLNDVLESPNRDDDESEIT